MMYAAIDIGCIECGESSAVLGVFTDEDKAQAVCDEHKARQKKNWGGQHYFEVFKVPDIDQEMRQEY